MRMWMTDPQIMCRQHLLGEHVELHMLVGHLRRGRRLGKLAHSRFLEPQMMCVRHEELVIEMLKRGYKHNSPFGGSLSLLHHLDHFEKTATVDREVSRRDLLGRCPECRRRATIC